MKNVFNLTKLNLLQNYKLILIVTLTSILSATIIPLFTDRTYTMAQIPNIFTLIILAVVLSKEHDHTQSLQKYLPISKYQYIASDYLFYFSIYLYQFILILSVHYFRAEPIYQAASTSLFYTTTTAFLLPFSYNNSNKMVRMIFMYLLSVVIGQLTSIFLTVTGSLLIANTIILTVIPVVLSGLIFYVSLQFSFYINAKKELNEVIK